MDTPGEGSLPVLEPGENLGGESLPLCSVERLQPVIVPRLHHISMYRYAPAQSRGCHRIFPIFRSFGMAPDQGIALPARPYCSYVAPGRIAFYHLAAR